MSKNPALNLAPGRVGSTLLRAGLLLVIAVGGLGAAGEWRLDAANSSVGFATIKNGVVGEGHHFSELSGTIDAQGRAQLKIGLASVDTGIPIRDERMRGLLFEVATFPSATVATEVPLADIEPLAVGSSMQVPLTLTLKLHGSETTLAAVVRVQRLDARHVLVSTVKPVLVSADDVGLAAGIEKLREIAGLQSISPAVPVSVVLAFVRH